METDNRDKNLNKVKSSKTEAWSCLRQCVVSIALFSSFLPSVSVNNKQDKLYLQTIHCKSAPNHKYVGLHMYVCVWYNGHRTTKV